MKAVVGALSWGGGTPRPGPYLTHVGGVPGALYLQSLQPQQPPPPPPPTAAPSEVQAWAWEAGGGAAGGAVQLRNTATQQCLGSAQGGVGAGNVWARWLAGGDVALLFFNTGRGAANVTCDAACLGGALGGAAAQWRARDVWRRADAGVVRVAEGYTAVGLAPQGGTLLLRLSPA